MKIRWFRATTDGVEPSVFPVFCATSAIAITLSLAKTALSLVAGAYWQATAGSGSAAVFSALLLWGVYQARRHELWRERIEHDIEAASHTASMLRLQREQLTRDMARYQSATAERRH